jgi:hypothetical protein
VLGRHGAGNLQELLGGVSAQVLRLLVPLLVGIFTHIMLQVYLERVSHGQFSGSFFEFIPHYFDGWSRPCLRKPHTSC